MKQIHEICLDVRGKAWITPEPGQGQPYRVVIQGAGAINQTHTTAGGRRVQIRAYHVPYNPNTGAQIARRQIMAEAVAAWHAADSSTRETARQTATNKRLPLFQAWCSNWLINHARHPATLWDPLPTSWDSGATTWDAAATTWDPGAKTTWDSGDTTWDDWPL